MTVLGSSVYFGFLTFFQKLWSKNYISVYVFRQKQPKTGTTDFQKNNYVTKYQYFLKSDCRKFHLAFKKTYNENQVKPILDTEEIHSGKNHVLENT